MSGPQTTTKPAYTESGISGAENANRPDIGRLSRAVNLVRAVMHREDPPGLLLRALIASGLFLVAAVAVGYVVLAGSVQ